MPPQEVGSTHRVSQGWHHVRKPNPTNNSDPNGKLLFPGKSLFSGVVEKVAWSPHEHKTQFSAFGSEKRVGFVGFFGFFPARGSEAEEEGGEVIEIVAFGDPG